MSLELIVRVGEAINEQALRRRLTPREKHMFGGLAFMLDDKMACGVSITTSWSVSG